MRTALLLATLVACGTSDDDTGPVGDTFIAFSTSFADFRTWHSAHSDGPVDDGTISPDAIGPRTLYIDPVPPSGATEFPVGTIVVEAREGNLTNIFARVKRGGGYNEGGARNWEWFELIENPVAIIWRGLGPPNGESYGGDPNACNSCHEQRCGANDFTCSPTLQLSSF